MNANYQKRSFLRIYLNVTQEWGPVNLFSPFIFILFWLFTIPVPEYLDQQNLGSAFNCNEKSFFVTGILNKPIFFFESIQGI